MGYYINPPDMSKEEFLEKKGKRLSTDGAKSFDFVGDRLPVCLVDNGWMTAAGIAFDARERDVFADPKDPRPKEWFSVARTDLKPYYPG